MLSLRSRRIASSLLVASTLALAACGGGGGESGGGGGEGNTANAAATVAMKPTVFEPADVKIKAGETVAWKWEGGVQHNVNGDSFKSELKTNGTFSHTFPTAGSFPYKCDVHPATMKGTVTVS